MLPDVPAKLATDCNPDGRYILFKSILNQSHTPSSASTHKSEPNKVYPDDVYDAGGSLGFIILGVLGVLGVDPVYPGVQSIPTVSNRYSKGPIAWERAAHCSTVSSCQSIGFAGVDCDTDVSRLGLALLAYLIPVKSSNNGIHSSTPSYRIFGTVCFRTSKNWKGFCRRRYMMDSDASNSWSIISIICAICNTWTYFCVEHLVS